MKDVWPYDKLVRVPRRRTWKKIRASRVQLERYEMLMILRDLDEIGGTATAGELDRRFPDRYNTTYLRQRLKWMHKIGVVDRHRVIRGGWLTGHSYSIPQLPSKEGGADAKRDPSPDPG